MNHTVVLINVHVATSVTIHVHVGSWHKYIMKYGSTSYVGMALKQDGGSN